MDHERLLPSAGCWLLNRNHIVLPVFYENRKSLWNAAMLWGAGSILEASFPSKELRGFPNDEADSVGASNPPFQPGCCYFQTGYQKYFLKPLFAWVSIDLCH